MEHQMIYKILTIHCVCVAPLVPVQLGVGDELAFLLCHLLRFEDAGGEQQLAVPPLPANLGDRRNVFPTPSSLPLKTLYMLSEEHVLGLHILLSPGSRGGTGVLQQGCPLMGRIPAVHRLQMMDGRQGGGPGFMRGDIRRLNITGWEDKSGTDQKKDPDQVYTSHSGRIKSTQTLL